MATDDREIEAILADPAKRISGDLRWTDDDPAGAREFVAPVICTAGELIVRGQRCARAGSLRFALVLRGVGRIACLDLGHDHQDPDGRRSGELHFHRWRAGQRDRFAEPIPTTLDLAGAWRQFCELTRIEHEGALADPAPAQETLL
jgi:hypothetical protein